MEHKQEILAVEDVASWEIQYHSRCSCGWKDMFVVPEAAIVKEGQVRPGEHPWYRSDFYEAQKRHAEHVAEYEVDKIFAEFGLAQK